VPVGSRAPPVVLTPLTRDLAALVASWFAEDEEGRRRLDADFYGARLKWWRLVEQSAVRHGRVGVSGDERIGFIDVEIDGERGGIAIYVQRDLRGRGVGQQLLRLAADEGRSLGIVELVGSVESDNVASIRCFLGAGFSPAGAEESGSRFRLHLSGA
jgi:GNAT superfamily N-acetyltransferase